MTNYTYAKVYNRSTGKCIAQYKLPESIYIETNTAINSIAVKRSKFSDDVHFRLYGTGLDLIIDPFLDTDGPTPFEME
jgi:hypothetical protein